MSDWTSLSVRESTRDRFNELKAKSGEGSIEPLSSDQFLNSLLDAWEDNGEGIYGKPTVATDEIAAKVANQLDSNSTQDVGPVELEASERSKIAREVVEALQR